MIGKYGHCSAHRKTLAKLLKRLIHSLYYTFSQVEMTRDIPADLDPKTFAIRHNRWYSLFPILQENLSVTIVPCKHGTDFPHYREEIKAFHYNKHIARTCSYRRKE